MQKNKKKKSIRIFVNEASIKFQLYLMKYANQLKQIDEKTTEEIIEKWNYDTQKKINRFKGDLEKDGFSDPVAQLAIKENIKYLGSLPAPIYKNDIHENFELARTEFINSLEIRIQENVTATLTKDIETLDYVKNLVLSPTVSKERFGTLLLLMIKNLATMPSFSGYSDNWKTDFYSNAVEKTILYLDNFDEKLKSKRTGQNSKAFAYVTQICFNAFVNIINIRKKEDAFLKDTISYETHNFDGVRDLIFKQRDSEEKTELQKVQVHNIIIKKNDTKEVIEQKIKDAFIHILDSNAIIESNKTNKEELEYLQRPGSVPEEEKTKDYFDYLEDLESKIMPLIEDAKKTTLIVTLPEGTNIEGIKYTSPKDIGIIITTRKLKDLFKVKEKIQGNKNDFNGYDSESGLTQKQQNELQKMEEDLQEEEDFVNEW